MAAHLGEIVDTCFDLAREREREVSRSGVAKFLPSRFTFHNAPPPPPPPRKEPNDLMIKCNLSLSLSPLSLSLSLSPLSLSLSPLSLSPLSLFPPLSWDLRFIANARAQRTHHTLKGEVRPDRRRETTKEGHSLRRERQTEGHRDSLSFNFSSLSSSPSLSVSLTSFSFFGQWGCGLVASKIQIARIHPPKSVPGGYLGRWIRIWHQLRLLSLGLTSSKVWIFWSPASNCRSLWSILGLVPLPHPCSPTSRCRSRLNPVSDQY